MGIFAEVIGTGPFAEDIVEYLNYSKEQYFSAKDEAVVNEALFGIPQANKLSRKLASTPGISDPWDFNQHKISTATIDLLRYKCLESNIRNTRMTLEIFRLLRKLVLNYTSRQMVR